MHPSADAPGSEFPAFFPNLRNLQFYGGRFAPDSLTRVRCLGPLLFEASFLRFAAFGRFQILIDIPHLESLQFGSSPELMDDPGNVCYDVTPVNTVRSFLCLSPITTTPRLQCGGNNKSSLESEFPFS